MEIAQKYIKVGVDFYNDIEKQKLLNYPTADTLKQIVFQPLLVPTGEFLTLSLLHRKKSKNPLFDSYDKLKNINGDAFRILCGSVDFNGHSISIPSGQKLLPYITEQIGEAIGLSVINKVHKLIEADWMPIDEKPHKTLDYSIASNGSGYIEVENKGSSNEDHSKKTSSVSNHYADIKKKKSVTEDLVAAGEAISGLRYGTITVMDSNENGNVKCWLTDPPATKQYRDPYEFKIKSRLSFFYWIISLISPKSQVTLELGNRLKLLNNSESFRDLDNSPLRRRQSDENPEGNSYETGSDQLIGKNFSFMSGKSRVVDGGGTLVRLSEDYLMMIGIRDEVLDYIVKQDFEQLTSLHFNSAIEEKDQISLVLSDSKIEKLNLSNLIGWRRNGRFMETERPCITHTSPSGLIYSFININ
ncbi:MAG TPA: hypothetical protein VES38_05650 [Methylotenera sp.]|nr:hypothetical protein [Methylotenera sp.]